MTERNVLGRETEGASDRRPAFRHVLAPAADSVHVSAARGHRSRASSSDGARVASRRPSTHRQPPTAPDAESLSPPAHTDRRSRATQVRPGSPWGLEPKGGLTSLIESVQERSTRFFLLLPASTEQLRDGSLGFVVTPAVPNSVGGYRPPGGEVDRRPVVGLPNARHPPIAVRVYDSSCPRRSVQLA